MLVNRGSKTVQKINYCIKLKNNTLIIKEFIYGTKIP